VDDGAVPSLRLKVGGDDGLDSDGAEESLPLSGEALGSSGDGWRRFKVGRPPGVPSVLPPERSPAVVARAFESLIRRALTR